MTWTGVESPVVLVSLLLGWRVVRHPVPILGIAVAGLTLSVAWSLAFLPPRAYRRRVRVRTSQKSAPA